MFQVFCTGHRARVLLDASRIEAIRNTSDGPVLDWRCWCGTRGSLLRGLEPADQSGSSLSPSHAA